MEAELSAEAADLLSNDAIVDNANNVPSTDSYLLDDVDASSSSLPLSSSESSYLPILPYNSSITFKTDSDNVDLSKLSETDLIDYLTSVALKEKQNHNINQIKQQTTEPTDKKKYKRRKQPNQTVEPAKPSSMSTSSRSSVNSSSSSSLSSVALDHEPIQSAEETRAMMAELRAPNHLSSFSKLLQFIIHSATASTRQYLTSSTFSPSSLPPSTAVSVERCAVLSSLLLPQFSVVADRLSLSHRFDREISTLLSTFNYSSPVPSFTTSELRFICCCLIYSCLDRINENQQINISTEKIDKFIEECGYTEQHRRTIQEMLLQAVE